MNYIPNNVIRQVLLMLIILLIAIILFFQLRSFLPAFLGAYTLYVIMRKYMFILQAKYRWRRSWSAMLLMFLSFLIILLPIYLLINLLSTKIAFAINHSSEVLISIEKFIQKYEKDYGMDILTDENIQKISAWGARTLPQILGATLNTLVGIIVMYFILFFMLTEGRKMESTFYEWVPLKTDNIMRLRKDTNGLVLSNAIGIPLIALLQGVVGLIGYLILGVREPMFWFVITCITAMLPIVGAAVAYVPVALLFFANGFPVKGVIMLIYGFGIIGTVDNVFRFWLQKKIGDVHPIITVFGVIVGLKLFGFIGLIFGPILISLFIMLIKIYTTEFSYKKEDLNKPEEPTS